MHSTFAGLETARRALFAQQAALQTTGHNIANANTPGYSRQRVNLNESMPYPLPGFNSPVSPGQIGTGVEAGTVQRVREDFLDSQYRGENGKYGYWGARSDALSKMEDIMNEPSDHGLSQTLDQFWESLEDLSDHPQDDGARSVVRERGTAVADTFRYISESLEQVQGDTKKEIKASVKDVNSLARQINSLNEQINGVEQHGDLANDLYDQRDQLVDQLSELAKVKVTTSGSGGESLDMAEGRYTVDLVDESGKAYTLVDGENFQSHEMTMSEGEGAIDHFSIGGEALEGTALSGKLQGMTQAYNTDYPDMLDSLDQMAYAFVDTFNGVHEEGFGLDGEDGYEFFAAIDEPEGAAQQIAVSDDIMDHLSHLAASANADAGDNGNAGALADVITGTMMIAGKETNVKDFYEGKVGGMAVDAQEARRMEDNTGTLRQSVEVKRQSISGVSLDEEMTNMMQFQHGYNAAARMMTIIDENLDRIINNMGVVGR